MLRGKNTGAGEAGRWKGKEEGEGKDEGETEKEEYTGERKHILFLRVHLRNPNLFPVLFGLGKCLSGVECWSPLAVICSTPI